MDKKEMLECIDIIEGLKKHFKEKEEKGLLEKCEYCLGAIDDARLEAIDYAYECLSEVAKRRKKSMELAEKYQQQLEETFNNNEEELNNKIYKKLRLLINRINAFDFAILDRIEELEEEYCFEIDGQEIDFEGFYFLTWDYIVLNYDKISELERSQNWRLVNNDAAHYEWDEDNLLYLQYNLDNYR